MESFGFFANRRGNRDSLFFLKGRERMNKLTEKAAEERREYMRNYMREYMKDYRQKNKEKMKQYQANYWNKRAAKMQGDQHHDNTESE